MESKRKYFIGGNWKSNNTRAQTKDLVESVLKNLKFDSQTTDVVIAPPFLQIPEVQELLKDSKIQVAAQNCSLYGFGAYTGEVSVAHLQDYNVPWVILGHSERRTIFGQSDQLVADKIKFVLQKGGVKVIACFGQTLQERESNQTNRVCERQLGTIIQTLNNQKYWQNIVLAYEPVWAIGTGKVATVEQVKQVHNHLREYLQGQLPGVADQIRLIYGGSVTDKNSDELLKVDNVDGFLVGGASLKSIFSNIVGSASK